MQWMKKYVVVLGGSLGTGMDTLVKMLKQLGHDTVDVDEIAQRLIQKGTPGYQQILGRFGKQLIDQTGQIDRTRLDQIFRADPRTLQEFRSLIYPLVKQELVGLIEHTKEPLIFIRTNNLDAYDLYDLYDQFWMISSRDEVRIANLKKEGNWSQEWAERYVRSQPQSDLELAQANVIFYNNGSRSDLWNQIFQAVRRLESQIDSNGETTGVLRTYPEYEVSRLPERHDNANTLAFPRTPRVSGDSTIPLKAEREISPIHSYKSILIKLIGHRISSILLILLAIAYLTSWGLILAEYGRKHLPILPMQAAWQALLRTGEYLVAHPQTYFWAREQVPWFQLVAKTLMNSAGLLLLSMGVALLLGLPLGIAAAMARHKTSSAIMMLISILGVSTPSFLFAMMLWVVNIWVYRTFDITVLPSTGFGWDVHLIMPVLVLAMRPLAQIAQVTYVSLRDILQQDYIRTAYSKGLTWRMVRNVHAIPNILIPTLNTLGSSLRFSLASLPIVEVFFYWPGVGMMLLDAIGMGTTNLVIDLILSLGLFFLFVNLMIEFFFPLIDPRLRKELVTESRADKQTILEWFKGAGNILSAWLRDLRQRITGKTEGLPPLVSSLQPMSLSQDIPTVSRRKWLFRNYLRNPAFIVGSIMMIVLIGLALFGESLTDVSPYQVHGIMSVDGKYGAPPFKPSSVFPWGTDHIGRDIQSLVLAGGKRTLSLAFFGMLARILLGGTLGILAGWQRDGWFDHTVTGAMGIWAAFPVTLFAMILIQGLGIQQGMWVFVVAISVVGWGEVAQFVRGQVITLKPQLFIESARSVGARSDQILVRHILPNLINPFIVLAALEMGGVLMLLAELGFLNIFMGGGFRAMIGESGAMVPVVAYYSDVPEWAAMIANVRQYWRSYPWMALYPGLAVFLSIMTFNLFSEGLRRFLDDTNANLSRLFNRYTFMMGVGITIVVALILQSSVPLSMYRVEGLKFDEQRVAEDIRILSLPQMQGRETGTQGADLASLYIAYRMAEIGIFPAGEHNYYFQRLIQPRLHLFDVPTFTLLNDSGQRVKEFIYKQDFVEVSRYYESRGEAQARVMGVAYGPALDPTSNSEFGLSNSAAIDHVIIVRAGDLSKVNSLHVKGILAIADENNPLERRDVYPYDLMRFEDIRPYLLISPQVADSLLRTAGSSLPELDADRTSLEPGKIKLTDEGITVSISLQVRQSENYLNEAYINVIGAIPGQGYLMGTDEQVIVVSAYYDGLGTDLTGTVYPGANDNASGVAMMLELARLLKLSSYQPDKTVLFVAWAGGERQEGLSIANVLNARPGANSLTVEAVIELSGVGYGTGKAISIGNDSSYRLVKLFQEAASRYNIPTTTRGRGPHYNLPALSIFGGRDAMTLSVSWDGSDHFAHTPQDTYAIINPAKLDDIGRSVYLTLLVLSRETEY